MTYRPLGWGGAGGLSMADAVEMSNHNRHCERMINVAIRNLTRGEPLPIDLESRLMAEGVDVAALKDKFEM